MDPNVALGAAKKYIPPFDIKQEIRHESNPTDPSTPSHGPSISPHSGKRHDPGGQLTAEIPGNPVLHNQSISEYLLQQLSVKRLNDIHQHLWWAGRPGNIRPLHRQRMMHREIMITEDPSLHLVWYDSTIYIKPLPLYLLQWGFFNQKICLEGDEELYRYATGFLFTYASLIRNQSDFKIALEMDLVPEQMTWTAWSSLATTFSGLGRDSVNKRYQYGELRLCRLNQISIFCCGKISYYSVYTQYGHFFSKNFAWLVLVFAYFSAVLAAMQVVLTVTTDVSTAFKNASYGFGIFTIVVVLVGVAVLFLLFVFLFVYFLSVTLKENRRVRTME